MCLVVNERYMATVLSDPTRPVTTVSSQRCRKLPKVMAPAPGAPKPGAPALEDRRERPRPLEGLQAQKKFAVASFVNALSLDFESACNTAAVATLFPWMPIIAAKRVCPASVSCSYSPSTPSPVYGTIV